ncbi:MAG: hypothetical protein ABSF60_15525, partial [Verrucomicrobiota bacterium]
RLRRMPISATASIVGIVATVFNRFIPTKTHEAEKGFYKPTFLSAGWRDILVPCFIYNNRRLESRQNSAMRNWKACTTS